MSREYNGSNERNTMAIQDHAIGSFRPNPKQPCIIIQLFNSDRETVVSCPFLVDSSRTLRPELGLSYICRTGKEVNSRIGENASPGLELVTDDKRRSYQVPDNDERCIRSKTAEFTRLIITRTEH